MFVGGVPIRNLWLLMLYASELFRARGVAGAGWEENPDELPDLVAELLAHAVEERMRRRLSSAYCERRAVLHRVRGRIDLLRTERHQLLARGMIACRFDELTIDTTRNRFVRGALESVSKMVRRPDLAHRCRALANELRAHGVSGQMPTRTELSTDRFGRHDAGDRFMVSAAKLALDLALPTEEAGAELLSRPDREETWIRRLFEQAVGGFYDVVARPLGWQVQRGRSLQWQIQQKTSGIDRILPGMRTDVMLEHASAGRRIVIDTKFTSILKPGWHRAETLRSGYLYQIYAYLLSQVGQGDPLADRASGMLLHPAVGETVDETVVIQGHAIRFATVDLSATAMGIRSRLLEVLTCPEASGANCTLRPTGTPAA